MNKKYEFIYTMATVLIVMGALFILQEEIYGLMILVAGISTNIVYRIANINIEKLKKRKIIEFLRCANIIFLLLTIIMFFIENEQRFNLLIVAILVDFIVNIKEISSAKKKIK